MKLESNRNQLLILSFILCCIEFGEKVNQSFITILFFSAST